MNVDVIVVGAGMAGLSCAHHLKNFGLECVLLEESDAPGGRVRTDNVDGFLLDRGFQVFLTAYPEAKRVLNYQDLKLYPFPPGALIRYNNTFASFQDPIRKPSKTIESLFSPIGTLTDKLKIAALRCRVRQGNFEEIYQQPQISTIDFLRKAKFSEDIIEKFFRPFFGGIFLESELETPSRMFEFVFRMFSEGYAALPSEGMGAVPRQIASHFPSNWIRNNCTVEFVNRKSVILKSGETVHSDAVVLATPAHVTAKLLGHEPPVARHVSCLYFQTPKDSIETGMLVLNGESRGLINNLCVLSKIAPSYAPHDNELVSITVLGTAHTSMAKTVRKQLKSWYGDIVSSWSLIDIYDIKHALPVIPALSRKTEKNFCSSNRIFICGDHRSSGSLQGAMLSGREAANAIASTLDIKPNP